MLALERDPKRCARQRALELRQMNAAFGLGLSGPTAAARVFAGLHRLGAREAADRQIAVGDQRVLAQIMRAHIVGEVGRRPARQRVDADARADRLEHRQGAPRRGLEALAAGQPGAERFDRTRHRLDLADAAAGVGVALVQIAVGIVAVEGSLQRRDHPDIGKAEIGGQRVAIFQRLAEMLSGVEEEDRQRAVDLRDHVEQHRRIRAERRYRRNAAGEILVERMLDDLLRRQSAVARLQFVGPARNARRRRQAALDSAP